MGTEGSGASVPQTESGSISVEAAVDGGSDLFVGQRRSPEINIAVSFEEKFEGEILKDKNKFLPK